VRERIFPVAALQSVQRLALRWDKKPADGTFCSTARLHAIIH
jgi:hypothetical protein